MLLFLLKKTCSYIVISTVLRPHARICALTHTLPVLRHPHLQSYRHSLVQISFRFARHFRTFFICSLSSWPFLTNWHILFSIHFSPSIRVSLRCNSAHLCSLCLSSSACACCSLWLHKRIDLCPIFVWSIFLDWGNETLQSNAVFAYLVLAFLEWVGAGDAGQYVDDWGAVSVVDRR